MLNERRGIETEFEEENIKLVDEQVRIVPNCEKVYKLFFI